MIQNKKWQLQKQRLKLKYKINQKTTVNFLLNGKIKKKN